MSERNSDPGAGGKSEEARLTGRCLCGGVRFAVSGPFGPVLHCHCLDCQRASGAGFATNLIVRRPQLEILSGEAWIRGWSSRPGKMRHFCGRCGSCLFNVDLDGGERCSVRTGCIDGPLEIDPSAHIFVRSARPWGLPDDGLPRYEASIPKP